MKYPMSWLADDRERLARFRRGDADVLAATYQRYSPAVAKMLNSGFTFQSATGPALFKGRLQPFDVDDLVQDAFVRAFSESARLRYDGLRSYQNYLFAIARNLLIDRHRKEVRLAAQVVQEDEVEDDVLGAQESGPDPERITMDRELWRLYEGFVNDLDEIEQSICRLRFLEKRTRQQVEMETGLSPMRLRTLERKLKQSLFAELVASGFDRAVVALWLFAALGTAEFLA